MDYFIANAEFLSEICKSKGIKHLLKSMCRKVCVELMNRTIFLFIYCVNHQEHRKSGSSISECHEWLFQKINHTEQTFSRFRYFLLHQIFCPLLAKQFTYNYNILVLENTKVQGAKKQIFPFCRWQSVVCLENQTS